MSSAYSPDESHRLPDPSSRRESRTPGGGGLKLLMYLVFVLALAATIIMFFVDSEMWLNVAVITSLWAAFFGAILVSRYSGVIGEERSRRQEQERRHKAELDFERAEAQRREVELEKDYRTRLNTERDATLDSIRKELEAMREQLSDLSGGEWTDEQVSLKARAERIIELERSGSRASSEPAAGSAAAAPKSPAPEQHAQPEPQEQQEQHSGGRRGGFATGTFAAVRWSGADSQDTTQIPMVVDTRAMEDGADTGSSAPAVDAGAEQPEAAQEPARQAPVEPEAPEPAAAEPASSQPEPSAPDSDESAGSAGEPRRRRAAEVPDEEAHGRRRADEHEGGLTVAQLMAQMKKNAK
ncbi:MAG: DUF6779 domain-containing protein [Mycobacteriaceae bacterium]